MSTAHPAQLFVIVAVVALVPASIVQGDLGRGGMVYILTAGIATAISAKWAHVLALSIAAPIIATALKLLFLRRSRMWLEHLIVTIEFFTLVLLIGTLETFVVILVGGETTQLYTGLLAASGLAYAASATLRRVYRVTVLESILGVFYLSVWAGAGVLFALELT
jgi:hypothetical protein